MKKAQVQISETILVIFIFLVLLSVGLVGFYKFNQYSINKIDETDRMNYFNNMIGTFSNMPEIKCSDMNMDMECVDALKLLAFKNKGDFGFSRVTVTKVYPDTSDKECTIDLIKRERDCGIFTIYENIKPDFSSKEIIYTPVSLYYPNMDKYYLGQLKIEVFR